MTMATAERGPAARMGIKEWLRARARGLANPIVGWLARHGAQADHLTALGFGISLVAGYAFFEGHFRLAALLLALGGVFDIFDGQLARATGGMTRFGAFLDSTLDRIAEAAALLGILGFCLHNLLELVLEPGRVLSQLQVGLAPETWAVVAFTAALALTGSFMVSYTRARAEGLGLECKVGWFERPERLVLLIVAALLKVFWAMSAALLLLTVLSFWTAYQRARHVWKLTRGARPNRQGGSAS